MDNNHVGFTPHSDPSVSTPYELNTPVSRGSNGYSVLTEPKKETILVGQITTPIFEKAFEDYHQERELNKEISSSPGPSFTKVISSLEKHSSNPFLGDKIEGGDEESIDGVDQDSQKEIETPPEDGEDLFGEVLDFASEREEIAPEKEELVLAREDITEKTKDLVEQQTEAIQENREGLQQKQEVVSEFKNAVSEETKHYSNVVEQSKIILTNFFEAENIQYKDPARLNTLVNTMLKPTNIRNQETFVNRMENVVRILAKEKQLTRAGRVLTDLEINALCKAFRLVLVNFYRTLYPSATKTKNQQEKSQSLPKQKISTTPEMPVVAPFKARKPIIDSREVVDNTKSELRRMMDKVTEDATKEKIEQEKEDRYWEIKNTVLSKEILKEEIQKENLKADNLKSDNQKADNNK